VEKLVDQASRRRCWRSAIFGRLILQAFHFAELKEAGGLPHFDLALGFAGGLEGFEQGQVLFYGAVEALLIEGEELVRLLGEDAGGGEGGVDLRLLGAELAGVLMETEGVRLTALRLSEAVAYHLAAGTMKPYTAKQGQYLAFIYYYTKIHGVAPAEFDMQKYFKVSPPSVHQMVVTLEMNGFIERVPGQGRSIRLLVPRKELPDLE
jgi:hypothetical protein